MTNDRSRDRLSPAVAEAVGKLYNALEEEIARLGEAKFGPGLANVVRDPARLAALTCRRCGGGLAGHSLIYVDKAALTIRPREDEPEAPRVTHPKPVKLACADELDA